MLQFVLINRREILRKEVKNHEFSLMVHIGQKIQELVQQLNMPITEFASKINKSRTVVYNIFERQTIDTGLLYTISEALEFNFFKLYFENETMANDPVEKYGKAQQQDVARQLSVYKKELDNAIEEINKLKKAIQKQKKYSTSPNKKPSGKGKK